MDAKTYMAVGELVQAAAHAHGAVGPVMFRVLTDKARRRRFADKWPVTVWPALGGKRAEKIDTE